MILERPASKAAIVFGGIAGAAVIACLAVEIHQRLTPDASGSASAGMSAFGDMVLGLGVFGLLALVPLALGLVWLRPVAQFWIVATWTVGLYALTGPIGLLVSGFLRESAGVWTFLADARIGFMPLGAFGLAIGCVLAPQVNQRWLLLGAALLDGGIFASVVLFKFLLPGW